MLSNLISYFIFWNYLVLLAVIVKLFTAIGFMLFIKINVFFSNLYNTVKKLLEAIQIEIYQRKSHHV